jgi:polyribonucleotide nucleotidyltransferase
VGRIDGEFIANPTLSQMATKATSTSLSPVPARVWSWWKGRGMWSVKRICWRPFFSATQAIQPIIDIQEQLKAEMGKPKRAIFEPPEKDPALVEMLQEKATAAERCMKR